MLAEYSVDGLLRYGVPAEVSAEYAVSLHDAKRAAGGHGHCGAEPGHPPAAMGQPGQRLRSAGVSGGQRPGHPGPGLPHLAGRDRQRPVLAGERALSAMTAWMLIGNWRHTRRRMQAQQALISETNFRRAMENSMLTGMRALDLQGRITYVNAGFLPDDRAGAKPSWWAARRPSPTGRRPTAIRWPPAWKKNWRPHATRRHPGSRQAQGRRAV